MDYVFNAKAIEKFTIDFIVRETGWQVGGTGDSEITFFKNGLLNNLQDKYNEWKNNTKDDMRLRLLLYVDGFIQSITEAWYRRGYLGGKSELFSYFSCIHYIKYSNLNKQDIDTLEIHEHVKELLDYYMTEVRNSIQMLDFHIVPDLEKDKFFCREIVEYFYDDFMNTVEKKLSSVISVYYYLDKNKDKIKEYYLSGIGQAEVLRCEAFGTDTPLDSLESITNDMYKSFKDFSLDDNGDLEIVSNREFIERWCPTEFLQQLGLKEKEIENER